MRQVVIAAAVLFVAAAAAFAAAPAKQEEGKKEDKKTVAETPKKLGAIITTEYGNIEIEFMPDKAPNHVKNFVKLAKDGFYDGTIFHRVIPGFMIQGGDPNTKGPNKATYGMGGPPTRVNAEFNDVSHKRGIVSMARANDPNSAGSQFFIVVADSTFLDRQYTVFGRVVHGMDVADQIVALPRDARDLPSERVSMKVKIIGEEK